MQSDGTHSNMRVYPVAITSNNLCDATAMRSTIEAYLASYSESEKGTGASLVQSFDHIADAHVIYKLSPTRWKEAVSNTPLLFLGLYSPTCSRKYTSNRHRSLL